MTGFNSKRDAAANKQHLNEDEWRRNNWRCHHGWLRGEQCEICNSPSAPQPAQEPVNLLEARKIAADYGMPDLQIDSGNLYFALMKCLEHIDALPAQEQWKCVGPPCKCNASNAKQCCYAVFTAPPQPAQEPVAWVCEGSASDEKHAIDYWQEDADDIPIGTLLYAAPPQRPWFGLTDAEIHGTPGYNETRETYQFALALIAKLKERNS
jgi:hypothetical protein